MMNYDPPKIWRVSQVVGFIKGKGVADHLARVYGEEEAQLCRAAQLLGQRVLVSTVGQDEAVRIGKYIKGRSKR